MNQANRPMRHGFAFPIADDLHARTTRVIQQLRQPNPTASIPLLLDVVIEAVDVGLDYFLIYPLELARVNRLSVNMAKMAVQTAKQAINVIVRRVLPGLNDVQLLAIAGFLETCLSHLEPGSELVDHDQPQA
jgi:hypothetical protein